MPPGQTKPTFLRPVLGALAVCLAMAGPACGEQIDGLHLLDIQLGSQKSRQAHQLASGGYELADGSYQSFRNWYSTKRPELSFLLLSQMSQNAAFIWGASTGERGEKYLIQPALRLGLLLQNEIAKGTYFSISGTVVLAGGLLERSCMADYGQIAGVQQVNCRLAASTLPPQDTLSYLIRESGWSDSRLTVSLEKRF